MLPKERKKIEKQRRRISFLILLVISLLIWIKIKQDDVKLFESELEYSQEVFDKQEKIIDSLMFKLDSIQNPKIIQPVKTTESKKITKSNIPKVKNVIKVDSIKIKIETKKTDKVIKDSLINE